MKIALVRKAYTPYGGAERYVSQIVEHLGARGHEVHIFAHTWEALPCGPISKVRDPVFHRVPIFPGPSFVEAWSFALSSKRLLQKESFDIIHSFERTFYQDIYRAGDGCHREWLIQRKKMDPWYKRLSHPVNPHHQSLLLLERRLFESLRLKRIIANSQRGKEEIIRHYRVPVEKIEVIYNGVNLERFHPRNGSKFRKGVREKLGIEPEAPVLLFLGSGFRRKGMDALIQAMPFIRKEISNIRLLIAGKDRTEKYREKIRKLGIAAAVLFVGATEKPEELYGASDLFVLPTRYDPFSNACLEAMATGIPVLTTEINGVAELIRPGENGFLIRDPLDPREITAGVLAFHHSPSRSSLGKRAREACLALNMESVVERMISIYEECGKG